MFREGIHFKLRDETDRSCLPEIQVGRLQDLLLSIPPEPVSQGGPYHFIRTPAAAIPVPCQHLLQMP